MIKNWTKVASISINRYGRIIGFDHAQNAYLVSFGKHGNYYCKENDLIVIKDREIQND